MGCTLAPTNNDDAAQRRRIIGKEIRRSSEIFRKERKSHSVMMYTHERKERRLDRRGSTRRKSLHFPSRKNYDISNRRSSMPPIIKANVRKRSTLRKAAFHNVLIVEDLKENLPVNVNREMIMEMVQNSLKGQIVSDPSQVVKGKTVTMEQVTGIASIIWGKLHKGKEKRENKEENKSNAPLLKLGAEFNNFEIQNKEEESFIKNDKYNRRGSKLILPKLNISNLPQSGQENELLKNDAKDKNPNGLLNLQLNTNPNNEDPGNHLTKGKFKVDYSCLKNVYAIVGLRELTPEYIKETHFKGKEPSNQEVQKMMQSYYQGKKKVKILHVELK